jgi:hypothetical protein
LLAAPRPADRDRKQSGSLVCHHAGDKTAFRSGLGMLAAHWDTLFASHVGIAMLSPHQRRRIPATAQYTRAVVSIDRRQRAVAAANTGESGLANRKLECRRLKMFKERRILKRGSSSNVTSVSRRRQVDTQERRTALGPKCTLVLITSHHTHQAIHQSFCNPMSAGRAQTLGLSFLQKSSEGS